MAQTYTLEEAADKLGIPADEFRRRLKTEWTHLRPMRDGNTLRFKERDVEELARQIGFGSEEELQLADPSSDEISVPSQLKSATKPAAKSDAPLDLGDKDVFLLADDKPAAPKSPSAKIKAPAPKSDSDVRLEKSGKIRTASREEVAGTEEIDLGSLPKSTSPSGTKLTGSGKLSSTSSTKLSSSKSGKASPPAPPKEADSSEFELNLDPDSSDEFELSLSSDSSDEISLGDMPPASPSKKGGQSGINIGKPSDSGPSLERKKGDSSKGKKSGKNLAPAKSDSDDEIDFELSLDQPGASSKKLGSKSSKKVDSDSEFELTLDDASEPSGSHEAATSAFHAVDGQKNDIFETDFEIPALDDDSASEAVALDEADTDLESSDFDLAIDEHADVSVDDESASQVVVLDDETGPRAKSKKKPAPKSKKKAALLDDDDLVVDGDAVSFDDMELDEGMSASKALKGAAMDADEDEEAEREVVVISDRAPWGAFPALAMLPTIFVIFLGGIMAYELMHSMWGYHQSEKPNSMVIDKVAEAFDLKPKETAK